ncbi:hypothetical protein B2K_40060 [Paenibacillus mucilaginosus K02]|uniref:Uncharacterized protein n=1 Tax=Paenibacillus mucilaginosus K02 TaxID=997761 RepID=R9UPL6_9BACL|nr:hypothetical protein B2K_40060 [Paenibacillus mucilaginosus K02]
MTDPPVLSMARVRAYRGRQGKKGQVGRDKFEGT